MESSLRQPLIELLHIHQLDIEIKAITHHSPLKKGVEHKGVVWAG
jgi:hypothetical protein